MLESKFQSLLIKKIQERFPGAILLKNDPQYLQGFPDWLVLEGNTWAALEMKASENSSLRPNQSYYIDLLEEMSFARLVHPGNAEEVLYELQQTFGSRGISRLLRR